MAVDARNVAPLPVAAEYLNTSQAASYLKISRRYLEALRLKGGGPPFISLGRCRRYRRCDIDAWAATRLRRSTSEATEPDVS
jgi:excisionase family DNA binding protein